MGNITLDDRRAQERFDGLPMKVKIDLVTVTKVLADELTSVAQALAEGALVKERSGKYVASIRDYVSVKRHRITGVVFSDAPEAGILEYGGTIPAHVILPNVAEALAFMGSAGQVFAARVNHPASKIAKRGVLHTALEQIQGRIVQQLTFAALGAAGKEATRSTHAAVSNVKG
jgi:hypothetical protein